MKNIFLSLIITGLILASCEKNDKTANRISVDEANRLITGWVFNEYNPAMNPSFSFDSITELTDDEIFSKTGGQVFSVKSSVPGLMNRWLFIKDNRVYDLHGFHHDQYATDADTASLLVTDLNGDDTFELCYTAYWGSGIIRSTVNCFYLSDDNIPHGSGADVSVNAYGRRFNIEKDNYQKVYLRYVKGSFSLIIGELGTREDNGMQVTVELYEGIPQDIIDILAIAR